MRSCTSPFVGALAVVLFRAASHVEPETWQSEAGAREAGSQFPEPIRQWILARLWKTEYGYDMLDGVIGLDQPPGERQTGFPNDTRKVDRAKRVPRKVCSVLSRPRVGRNDN
jgi:hypothetical protein